MKNYFNFEKFEDKFLITNDLGRYAFIQEDVLKDLVKADTEIIETTRKELMDKYFIYDMPKQFFASDAGHELRHYKQFLFAGPTLHIFILTKRCNQNCVYCQASTSLETEGMMSQEIAEKAVDIALSSPGKYLTFEFQGGEPLINFALIKYIVEYTEKTCGDKIVNFILVSNLSLMSDEILAFLCCHNIDISTSIDGDKEIHDSNRPMGNKGSYELAVQGIGKIRHIGKRVSAIQTTTKYSLNNWREIVDEYVRLDFSTIFLRPLTRLGYAEKNWGEIGYSPEEFLVFYKKSFEYIIELNKNGYRIAEGLSVVFLSKILNHESGNYMELRSPCGAGIGQLAYQYNGDIYTCDEARMLAEMGNDNFKLGNVNGSDLNGILEHPVCKSTCIASCLENLSDCNQCVYSPYCGTCPVINYALYNTIFPSLKGDFRCKIYKGILDVIFNYLYLDDKIVIGIFESWIN